MENRETLDPSRGANQPRIRWGRVILAAILAEAAVILAILAVTLTYRLLIAPGRTAAEYQEFSELAGYYIGPAGGGLMTFVFVVWACRRLPSRFIAHGVLIGVAGVLLTGGFIVGAKPEHRLMYVVSYVLRIVAGYLGGWAVQEKLARVSRPVPAGQP